MYWKSNFSIVFSLCSVFCDQCSMFCVLCSHSTPFAAEPRPNAVPALRQDSRWQRLRNQPLIELYTTALLPLQFYNLQTTGTLYMVQQAVTYTCHYYIYKTNSVTCPYKPQGWGDLYNQAIVSLPIIHLVFGPQWMLGDISCTAICVLIKLAIRTL